MQGDDCVTPHRLQGTVVWLFSRASLRAQHAMRDRLERYGIRRNHYAVLATLHEFGPATQAEIGRRVGMDRSDMVAVLNDLEEQRYLRRAQDPADRRRNQVTLTQAGQRALRRFDAQVVDVDDELLGRLSAVERAQLIKLLERVVES